MPGDLRRDLRRVVVATDKFKGSLSAADATAAVAAGLRRAGAATRHIEVLERPLADGGEGTVDVAARAGFERVETRVRGPLGAPVRAAYAVRGTTAVLESAAAAGLALLPAAPSDDTARRASSAGVGELIRAALERGARTVTVGLGGSASTDGGAGAVGALGAVLRTGAGEHLGPGGAPLRGLDSLDLRVLEPALRDVELVVACDVDNPLTGPRGAAAVFAPQKGAAPGTVAELDVALTRWADVVAAVTGRDLRAQPGAGAAGGIGFGLLAVLGGRVASGIGTLLELTGFAADLDPDTLVVVGEGSLDEQSLGGKSPIGVAAAARAAGAVTVAVAGRSTLRPDQAEAAGLAAVYAICDLQPDPARQLDEAASLLERLGARLGADWLGLDA